MRLLFILGAGASVDSGLLTYRGINGIYNDNDEPERILSKTNTLDKIWNFLQPLYDNIDDCEPGPTYTLLSEIVSLVDETLILTQNIDGYAKTVNNESCKNNKSSSSVVEVVEIHGSNKTMTCSKCKVTIPTDFNNLVCSCMQWYRPDIVLYGEDLDNKKVTQVFKYIKSSIDYVIVVGTTLSFQYLHKIIRKAKQRCASVIYINPDPEYSPSDKDGWYSPNSIECLSKFLKIVKKISEEREMYNTLHLICFKTLFLF